MEMVRTAKSVDCMQTDNVENIFKEREDVVLVIPESGYTIGFDVTSKGRTTDTLVIEWAEHNVRYVIIPALKDDFIIKKYDFDSGMAYYILRIENGYLTDFAGIDRETYNTHYYEKNDFIKGDSNGKARILQAPIIALYAPGLYVNGLRELGYHAEQMARPLGNQKSFIERELDFELDLDMQPTEVCRGRMMEFFIYALYNYDIIHCHSNCSLLYGQDRLWNNINADMAFLKKMGKIIVHSSWGICDDNYNGEERQFGWFSECKVCTSLKSVRCECEEYNHAIKVTLENADCLFANTRSNIIRKERVWIDNPIDFSNYPEDIVKHIPEKYKLSPTDKIRIFHCFANADMRDDIKGSGCIKKVVAQLQSEGYNVEFIYFTGVSHKDIKYYQAQADIVVDQLYGGWYGSNGVECLALGKPVITYVNPDVDKYMHNVLKREHPLICANPDTIYEVLKELLNHPEKCKMIGKKSREYALKYHDYRVVVKQLSNIYDSLMKKNI